MTAASEPYRTQVLELLRWRGFAAVHFRAGQDRRGNWSTAIEGDGEGFPDILAVGGPTLLVVEVKSDGEDPTPEQWGWLMRFRLVADAVCWVLRPSDGLDWGNRVSNTLRPQPPVYGWDLCQRPDPPKAPNPYRNRPQARQRAPRGQSADRGGNSG